MQRRPHELDKDREIKINGISSCRALNSTQEFASKTPTKDIRRIEPLPGTGNSQNHEKLRRIEPLPGIPRTHLRRTRLVPNQPTNPLSRNSYLRGSDPSLLNNSDGEKNRKNEPRNSPRAMQSGPLLLLLVLPPLTTRPRRRLPLRYGPERGGIHGWNSSSRVW